MLYISACVSKIQDGHSPKSTSKTSRLRGEVITGTFFFSVQKERKEKTLYIFSPQPMNITCEYEKTALSSPFGLT